MGTLKGEFAEKSKTHIYPWLVENRSPHFILIDEGILSHFIVGVKNIACKSAHFVSSVSIFLESTCLCAYTA